MASRVSVKIVDSQVPLPVTFDPPPEVTFTGGSVNAVQSGAWTVSLGAPVTISGNVSVANPSQGADSASVSGPMVQGVINEAPTPYVNGEIRPLSLTAQGRLRVSTAPAEITRVWQHTTDDPWAGAGNPFGMESPYV